MDSLDIALKNGFLTKPVYLFLERVMRNSIINVFSLSFSNFRLHFGERTNEGFTVDSIFFPQPLI